MKTKPSHSEDRTVRGGGAPNLTRFQTNITPRSAFTSFEAAIVIAFTAILLIVFLMPQRARSHVRPSRIACVNNLKQLGMAYQFWMNDHGGLPPSELPVTNGGWNDVINQGHAGFDCWTNFTILQNELGQSARVLICPDDERTAATNFANIANTNISYFVGIGTRNAILTPHSILGGDRNLAPGLVPDAAYGFSPANGKGNDVQITGPVCWSLKMHSQGNVAGAGNILLADGSAQQVTSSALRQTWLPPALAEAQTTPKNSPGIRLIFP